MRHLPTFAGALLGLAFIAAAVTYFFHLVDAPPPPEGTPPALFFAAFYPTGYLDFVKSLEIIGGILVAIPYTRRVGLLILGPIFINILAFHYFVAAGEGLFNAPILVIFALMLYLVWVERQAFITFIRGPVVKNAA